MYFDHHYILFNRFTHFAAITTLAPEDSVLDYGALGNFSLSGFEMVDSQSKKNYAGFMMKSILYGQICSLEGIKVNSF